MSIDDDYRDLLNKMAAKRAVERFLIGAVLLCLVCIGTLLFLQDRSLTAEIKGQQQAIADQDRHFAQQQTEIEQQSAQIRSYILCIAQFFAQPNHNNLSIQNIESCQFSSTAYSGNSSALPVAVVPSTPRTSSPIAQQPTTSEPPKPTNTTPPKQDTPTSPPPKTPPATNQPSVFQRTANWLHGLVKALPLL